MPAPIEVTCEEGEPGVVNTPLLTAPLLQTPVPIAGVFAAIVALNAQMVWVGPATAGVGNASTFMLMVDVDGGHTLLEICHCKMCVPTVKPVTVVLGKLGFVIVAVPETKLHTPVPTAGVFPARVALPVLIHIVCDGPAFALEGGKSRITVTVEDDAGHTPLVIVQIY